MSYFRSALLIFLSVFFVDRVMPGIQIASYEGVANVGADLFFALVVGFLCASVFPVFSILDWKITGARLLVGVFSLSFASFLFLSLVSAGIEVTSFWGILGGGFIVGLVALITNYLEWQYDQKGSSPKE